MRIKIILLVAVTLGFFLSFKKASKAGPVNEPGAKAAMVPLYRLVDPYGYHFYTTNVAEKNSAVRDLSYKEEGSLGYVYTQQQAGTVPLYRFASSIEYITDIHAGKHVYVTRHLYTTNAQESMETSTHTLSLGHEGHSALSGSYAYTSEGIQCYISATSQSGTKPVYRLRQDRYGPVEDDGRWKMLPGATDFFYTVSEDEKFTAVNKLGYVELPVVGYTWSHQLMIKH